jgi:hypothetical protein
MFPISSDASSSRHRVNSKFFQRLRWEIRAEFNYLDGFPDAPT